MQGALSGIKVIDLSTVISGPLSAAILADQGADVIKVEPLKGEQLRLMSSSKKPVSPTFFSCNRGKRSIAIDLKKEDGKSILLDLVKTADVLIQNFRPGAMARMGFSSETLRKLNPGLIYVSISGFGEEGPYANKRVYDPVIQALSGATDIQAERETGYPQMFRLVVADKVASLTAAQAISSALFARTRTGEGQEIKVSMLDALISFLWPSGMPGLTFAEEENTKQVLGTRDLVFETKDGYITAGAVSDSEWIGMCAALKRPDWLEDERFSTSAGRAKNGDIRREIMAGEIKNWTSHDALSALDSHDVPCAPVLSRGELLENEQLIESNTIIRKEYEEYGEVRQARPPALFEKTPSDIQSGAPKLGEHSESILETLGYDQTRIQSLIENKTIGV